MATKSKAHAPEKAQPAAFLPDAERIELVGQLIEKAYRIGRVLESMQRNAFDDPHDDDGGIHYAVTSRELGARVRALTQASLHLLKGDPGYSLSEAWGVLHG